MPAELNRPCVEMEQVGNALVVRFTCRTILDDRAVTLVGEQLAAALEGADRPRIVLDFGRVESVSTMMVSKLVTLSRKVEAAGGRLALCRINPFLSQIFSILKLPQVLAIYGEEHEALERL
jgi:anti-sigma B factor antagonist